MPVKATALAIVSSMFIACLKQHIPFWHFAGLKT
jgi:hypothetical protein